MRMYKVMAAVIACILLEWRSRLGICNYPRLQKI